MTTSNPKFTWLEKNPILSNISSADVQQLTRLLYLNPSRSVAHQKERWLDYQKIRIKSSEPSILRSKGVFSSLKGYMTNCGILRDPARANLCSAHQQLNPKIIRALTMLVADECIFRAERFRHFRNRNTEDIDEMVDRWIDGMNGIRDFWVAKDKSTDLPKTTVDSLPGNYATCEACKLAILGGSPGMLRDLRASLIARREYMRDRMQKYVNLPQLAKFVDSWLTTCYPKSDRVNLIAESEMLVSPICNLRVRMRLKRELKMSPSGKSRDRFNQGKSSPRDKNYTRELTCEKPRRMDAPETADGSNAYKDTWQVNGGFGQYFAPNPVMDGEDRLSTLSRKRRGQGQLITEQSNTYPAPEDDISDEELLEAAILDSYAQPEESMTIVGEEPWLEDYRQLIRSSLIQQPEPNMNPKSDPSVVSVEPLKSDKYTMVPPLQIPQKNTKGESSPRVAPLEYLKPLAYNGNTHTSINDSESQKQDSVKKVRVPYESHRNKTEFGAIRHQRSYGNSSSLPKLYEDPEEDATEIRPSPMKIPRANREDPVRLKTSKMDQSNPNLKMKHHDNHPFKNMNRGPRPDKTAAMKSPIPKPIDAKSLGVSTEQLASCYSAMGWGGPNGVDKWHKNANRI